MGLKFNFAKSVVIIVGKCYTSTKNLLLYNQVLPWSEGLGLCNLGVAYKTGNSLSVDISTRSQKFIGSVASMLRGCVFGAKDGYIHVIKTKGILLLFYGVDCLRVDAYAMEKLSVI